MSRAEHGRDDDPAQHRAARSRPGRLARAGATRRSGRAVGRRSGRPCVVQLCACTRPAVPAPVSAPMPFAPEYVRDRPQRELRGCQGAVPRAAAGHPRRAPRDAGRVRHRGADADARCIREAVAGVCRDAVRDSRYDGSCEDLFFFVERLIAERAGERRRPAPHRAQPQRHRHDDVPHAAARVRARPDRGDAGDLRATLLGIAAAHLDTVFPAHTHTQRAQPTTLAHYLLGVVEQLERDARAAARGVRHHQPLAARAPARSPAPPFRSIATGPARCSASTRRPGTPTAASPRSTTCSRASSAAAVTLVGVGRVVQDLLLWCTAEFRYLRLADGLRAGEQHHAAEAQPGGARARALDRQQGARPGDSGDAERAQHALRRHRRHRGRPAAARPPRRSATRCAPSRWWSASLETATFDVAEMGRRAARASSPSPSSPTR